AGFFQLDALQPLGLGLPAALVGVAVFVPVLELLLIARRLLFALGGHVAAVGQIVVPGAELIHVHIHGAGIHLHLGAVDLDLLGGHRLFDAGIRRQFLHGDALFLAPLARPLGLAWLGLAGLG